MSVLLAVCGALIYGFADFAGGLASRRAAALAVVFTGQAASLVILVAVLLVFPAPFSAAGVAWGTASGGVGAVALLLFYRSLSLGAMSVIAPLTALVSAIVPVVAGIVLGERPSPIVLLGVVISLSAVVLVAAEGGRIPTIAALQGPVVAGALLAGTGFGFWIVLLSRAPADSGFWPTFGARCASIALLALVGVIGRRSLVPRGAPPALVVAAGSGDLIANFLFVLASRTGLLSVTGVLLGLYPTGTVLLALLVLKERLHRVQVAGLGLAVAGVVLIALG